VNSSTWTNEAAKESRVPAEIRTRIDHHCSLGQARTNSGGRPRLKRATIQKVHVVLRLVKVNEKLSAVSGSNDHLTSLRQTTSTDGKERSDPPATFVPWRIDRVEAKSFDQERQQESLGR